MIDPSTTRVQQDYNARWVDANPELFGRSVQKFLTDYPPTDWTIKILPAYMPGAAYMISAVRKDVVHD